MQRAFARGAHGTRVIDIFPEIRAVVDSGNHHVRFFRQKFVQRHDPAIRRRPVNRPLALRNLIANDRLPQRQRLRRPAALQARRHNTHRGKSFQRRRQRAKSFRLISVVVGQKNRWHGRIFPMLFFLEIFRVRGLPPVAARDSFSVSEEEMVGTARFELATSRTPSVRATRLRYVPTGKLTATGQRNQKAESGEGISTSKVSPPFEQRQECAERVAQIEQHLAAQKLRGPFRRGAGASAIGFGGAIVLAEMPPRARDCESLVVQQPLDAEDHIHIVLAVESTAAGAFQRLKHGEFGFPVAKDERFQIRQAADFADAVEFFLRGDLRCCAVASHLKVLSGGRRRYRSSLRSIDVEGGVHSSRSAPPPDDLFSRLRRRWMKRTGVPTKSYLARSWFSRKR